MHENNDAIIREPCDSDAQAIANCLGELGYPQSVEFVVNRLVTFGARADHVARVAVRDGHLAGFLTIQFVQFFHYTELFARITALVVSSTHQRSGIGRILMSEAERLAWERGCFKIELTTLNDRKEARQFYLALDYRQDAVRFTKLRPT